MSLELLLIQIDREKKRSASKKQDQRTYIPALTRL